MKGHSAIAALLIASAAAPALAEFRPIETSIAFVSNGGIRDWRAEDRDTLYIQDRQRNWHRAELFGGCHDLPYAQAIGFETRGTDRLDRFSSILVRGQRCAIRELVASGPPLPKKERALIKG